MGRRDGKFHPIAVFLGPSLPPEQARGILAADYHPPARKGDIYRILATGVETIILVDGVFHNTPSIWPREILDALQEGIQVVGASSMGALRAAELHPFGMMGFGTIFDWYRDGTIDGDDEVAVWHRSAEEGFRPLSEALVNIRYTLRSAVADGRLSADRAQRLTDHAKQLYYPERSYGRLLNSPILKGWSEYDRVDLRRYFSTEAVNLKKLDAIGVLQHFAKVGRPGQLAPCPEEVSSPGTLWQLMRPLLGGFVGTHGVVTGEAVLAEAETDTDLVADMWVRLSRRCFLLEWARQHKVLVPEGLLDDYIQGWERDHDIDQDGQWLRANGLTPSRYRRLLADRALVDWMIRQRPAQLGSAERSLSGQEDLTGARPSGELAENHFLLEWARENGVSFPADPLDRSSDGIHLRECAVAEWITAQGPIYFGLPWSFEEALLGELQITGLAARLLHRRRGE
jgi:hypothetical protein